MLADQARAVGATIALGVNPKSISISYLSRSATDRDNWGPGRSLHGGLYNYTLSFPQAPSVSTSWRCVSLFRQPLHLPDAWCIVCREDC